MFSIAFKEAKRSEPIFKAKSQRCLILPGRPVKHRLTPGFAGFVLTSVDNALLNPSACACMQLIYLHDEREERGSEGGRGRERHADLYVIYTHKSSYLYS